MSQSILGLSPWRRRASSLVTSLDQPRQEQQDASSEIQRSDANGAPLSPSRSSEVPGPSARDLSSSISSGHTYNREPIRSFIHGSVREHLAPVDSVQNARTVREDTAELACYVLADGHTQRSASFLQKTRPSFEHIARISFDSEANDDRIRPFDAIPGATVSSSFDNYDDGLQNTGEGPSALANLLRTSPPESAVLSPPAEPVLRRPKDFDANDGEGESSANSHHQSQDADELIATESSPLLGKALSAGIQKQFVDLERQKQHGNQGWLGELWERTRLVERKAGHVVSMTINPKHWDRKAIWQTTVVTPVACLPAVCVGLLLNILDALSYGMILFPLGKQIFSHLGSAGISIFYVSTIVSQLTFSSGSIFRGAVGSELIEVVPFFHHMAEKITIHIGAENPDAVIATTVVSYAISSMVTGLVFWLMGQFKFGYMVGFIPRHILIGCIGGVGWFLVATGFEVSARLDGSLEYNLDTFYRLTDPKTVPLWVIPLVLAIVLFWGQSKVASKYFLPLYILAIPLIFYFFVFSLDILDKDILRDQGWIFEGPPSDEPWWYFYTLYKFRLVRWDAVAQTIPAMLALTFFGILHVPINVPALALNCGEDNADLDKELRLHGYSNFLSGCAGSIQNYLVYANTVFFMRSGGDTRLAGYMLAGLTFFVMIIGPKLIGFIPVMMVGCLIFDLGFELLLEAVWLPRKKLKLAEHFTVFAIVLVMGIYDFVVGIGVGVLLAFVALIVQTSRISAIRGTYAGDVVNSTVRRNPSQHHYLSNVGKQIYIIKLTGYLFFGTIVSVEEKIRAMLDDNTFAKSPIKFLVLDMWYVSGLDYSAGEAFNTISRLLSNKGVVFVLSGVDDQSQLSRSLRAVGLGGGDAEVTMLPDLNSALESCENELLKTLYASEEEVSSATRAATATLDIPEMKLSGPAKLDTSMNSPRRNYLVEAAHEAIQTIDDRRPRKWESFREPLRLLLQIFQGLSDQNEDFWFPATAYFKRRECPANTVLFRRGEEADGFYLVERGIIRAEYDLPQGWLCESIVAGTTCGELPFFSETDRTATAVVERGCVVWLMDQEDWKRLQEDEPDIARELLRVSLKLTSERMSAITSYILAMAG